MDEISEFEECNATKEERSRDQYHVWGDDVDRDGQRQRGVQLILGPISFDYNPYFV